MITQQDVSPEQRIEEETQHLAGLAWDQLIRQQPTMLHSRWWDDQLLSWAMNDEAVKVQLFRFVDVLPMLKDYQAINQHLHELFEEVREHLPWAGRLALNITDGNRVLGRALAMNARSNARRMAQRFIAGAELKEVTKAVCKIRDRGFAFTLDLLGELVLSHQEADRYQQSYLELLQHLPETLHRLPESAQIDCNHLGSIPRVNLSLKLSALDPHFQPADPVGTCERVSLRLRPILRLAREQGAFIHFDMEHYAYKSLTSEIFMTILMEEEFRDWADVGIVCQAYLKESADDLQQLLAWVQQRETPITVRLVKGAYWDYEVIQAGLKNWPVPVYEQKCQTDANFEDLTRFLFDHYDFLSPAIASHNLRSLSYAATYAKQNNVPRDAWEMQMLYGMGEEQAHVFANRGHRVRIYAPFGESLPGMAYLVRRLLENTSNDSFVTHVYQDTASREELLMNPRQAAKTASENSQPPLLPFMNEPTTDFSQKKNRDLMEAALKAVQEEFGQEYPIIIQGKIYETRQQLTSRCPFDQERIVGRVSSATTDMAEEAIQAARRSLPEWLAIDADHRAEYLDLLASQMRERRFELAAWLIYEIGKTWTEADAEVAEAIDFCRYYALQMRAMENSLNTDLAGEENQYFYRPRGVAVVIAPWNFPLAILTGMTAAALVTGNTVIMKPAEQSPVIAAKLMEMLKGIGLPDGVVNYLPGIGEEIGPELVSSPDVDVIAFTGSRDVGLEINSKAAQASPHHSSVKKVIAEMGGKNAIIVDDDADLDEAVAGVMQSAFSYAGQKCSACSRVIVVGKVYQEFVDRLKAATESLLIGPADQPSTQLGPVIDEEARERIEHFLQTLQEEGLQSIVETRLTAKLADAGEFIPPHIFVDVPVESALAEQEIFGPVLAVFSVKDFSEAIKLANNTEYALTGGVYSRSPVNLKRARQEFLVGNLYLNRNITGALVHRQPFGGFRMSGIGTKAGGNDYLHEFLIPVNITENTMRRGYAPQES